MSYDPCSHCSARYKGPGHSVYLATGDGVELNRRRLKLCPECGTQATTILEATTRGVDPELGLQEPMTAGECSHCGDTSGPLSVLFATEYEPGQVRRDWFARLCDECMALCIVDLDPVPLARTKGT